MASAALSALRDGLVEVRTLASADPTRPGRLPINPDIARAVGRGCVVLLTGHFEGYLSSLNEEAVDAVNNGAIPSEQLSATLRARHSRTAIEALAKTQWPNRGPALEQSVRDEGWMWTFGATGRLRHDRLVEGITSPMPDDLKRYFEMWGIADVFSSVTRKQTTRGRLWLGISDLVDKRHAIAHGDASAEATKADVVRYLAVVETFTVRADRVLARQLAKRLTAQPW